MENMVHVFIMGKQYEVPSNLTIMGAMEYAGYQLVRGCGCRNGFCTSCTVVSGFVVLSGSVVVCSAPYT